MDQNPPQIFLLSKEDTKEGSKVQCQENKGTDLYPGQAKEYEVQLNIRKYNNLLSHWRNSTGGTSRDERQGNR